MAFTITKLEDKLEDLISQKKVFKSNEFEENNVIMRRRKREKINL